MFLVNSQTDWPVVYRGEERQCWLAKRWLECWVHSRVFHISFQMAWQRWARCWIDRTTISYFFFSFREQRRLVPLAGLKWGSPLKLLTRKFCDYSAQGGCLLQDWGWVSVRQNKVFWRHSLTLLDCPLVWGWNPLERLDVKPADLQKNYQIYEVNCGSLSVNIETHRARLGLGFLGCLKRSSVWWRWQFTQWNKDKIYFVHPHREIVIAT